MNRRQVIQWMGAAATGIAVPTLLTGCEAYDQPQIKPSANGPKGVVAPQKLVKALKIRRSQDRGMADHGWLKAKHSFSFARYRDPEHMGFRALRVLNEDVIHPGRGFGMHPHRDMEIITYILDGALEHKDSMGNGSVIRPGEVQAMSAGTGVRHSEFNPSGSEHVHLMQIWLLPDKRYHKPRYQQKPIVKSKDGPIQLIASPDGRDGSVAIHQNAYIHACDLKARQAMSFDVHTDRHAWVQVASGSLTVNGHTLKQGDGLSTSDNGALLFTADRQGAKLLIFDLA